MKPLDGIKRSQHLKYGYFQILDHFFGRHFTFRLHNKSRRRLYSEIHVQLKERGEGKVLPVERRENLTEREFFKEYVRKNKPVILAGAAAEWGCCKKWSLEYFKELHGDDEIVIAGSTPDEPGYEALTLAELIDNIQTGGGKYYRFYPLLSRHPEHLVDFDYKWLRERKYGKSYGEFFQVFMGGKGTKTPMHNAPGGNLFTQAFGEKIFRLYPPNATMIVDPEPTRSAYRSAPHKKPEGCFDPFNPDFETPYTLFKYVDSYEAHLKKGDVFYNPPQWWHSVMNPTDSIGVGFRWWAPKYALRSTRLYSTLDMFVLNPPIWKLKQIFDTDYNIVHLMQTGQLENYLAERAKKSQGAG